MDRACRRCAASDACNFGDPAEIGRVTRADHRAGLAGTADGSHRPPNSSAVSPIGPPSHLWVPGQWHFLRSSGLPDFRHVHAPALIQLAGSLLDGPQTGRPEQDMTRQSCDAGSMSEREPGIWRLRVRVGGKEVQRGFRGPEGTAPSQTTAKRWNEVTSAPDQIGPYG